MTSYLEYVPGTSFLHRMNPVAKIACALLVSVACFCSTNLVFLALVAVGDFALARSCGMTRQAVGLAKAVLAFSVLLAVIQLLTTPEGTELIPLPWGYVGTGSIYSAVCIVVRLVACAVPLFLVLYVTKLSDITNSLVKVVHVPYKYAFTFSMAVRFIPVFMNDMSAIMEAQTARGVEFDTSGIVQKVRLMVPLCVPLLVSSVRKTSSAAIAAEVRGFNLRTRESGYKDYPFAAFDVAAMVACAALVVASVLVGVLL